MEIFQIEDNIVKPTPEALLIPVFKKLWDRDKSKHKDTALNEFALVYFMCSPKKSNPYWEYEEVERERHIINELFDGDYEIGYEVGEALSWYKRKLRQGSVSFRYYEKAKETLEKLIDYFDSVDFDERDERGRPIFTAKEVIDAVSKAPDVLKSVEGLKKKVLQELYESTKTKGDRDVNPLER